MLLSSIMGQVGAKMKDSFQWIGHKIEDGWNGVKDFGNKVWNGIKSVPVLGQIASGIEKYTPIGWGATNLAKAIDTGVTAGSKLVQGDLNGAVKKGLDYGKDIVNQKNPLLEKIKSIPVIGKVASGLETVANNVPIYGGLSANSMKGIANGALNSADSLRQGDLKGALSGAVDAGLAGAGGGAFGKIGKVVATGASLGKRIV